MEMKTKLIEEIKGLVADFEVVDTTLQESLPKSQAEHNTINSPGNKGKKMRLAALNAKKLDLTYKINSLSYVLINYFAEDLTDLIPIKMNGDLEEYNKLISGVVIRNGVVSYNAEFEDFFNSIEGFGNN